VGAGDGVGVVTCAVEMRPSVLEWRERERGRDKVISKIYKMTGEYKPGQYEVIINMKYNFLFFSR
jgi:hypothetical protein